MTDKKMLHHCFRQIDKLCLISYYVQIHFIDLRNFEILLNITIFSTFYESLALLSFKTPQ